MRLCIGATVLCATRATQQHTIHMKGEPKYGTTWFKALFEGLGAELCRGECQLRTTRNRRRDLEMRLQRADGTVVFVTSNKHTVPGPRRGGVREPPEHPDTGPGAVRAGRDERRSRRRGLRGPLPGLDGGARHRTHPPRPPRGRRERLLPPPPANGPGRLLARAVCDDGPVDALPPGLVRPRAGRRLRGSGAVSPQAPPPHGRCAPVSRTNRRGAGAGLGGGGRLPDAPARACRCHLP